MTETIHACPPDGSGITPCCGRTPFELPLGDRISSETVTCSGAAPAEAQTAEGPDECSGCRYVPCGNCAPVSDALRQQYAKAIHRYDYENDLSRNDIPSEHHRGEADAVMAVRDTELQQLRAQVDDERAAKKIASDSADRFRDVLSEALGFPDENPGDDVLVAELRAHFGKTGPEPTRWRDFMVGAEAIRDQIIADDDQPSACGQEQP